METGLVIHYSTTIHHLSSDGFEEAFYNSRLHYSLRHLMIMKNAPPEEITEALQKSLRVCHLAGIDSKHHFKKIYVFDSIAGEMHTDWMMSKNGFNLMVIQINSLSEKRARWLWELTGL